jgi:hypothetical protein
MKYAFVSVLGVLSAMCFGCSDDGSKTPDQGGGACVQAITASQASNYSFSSTLSFPPVAVKPDSELSFEWSKAMVDFLGHPLSPVMDVDAVNLMLWTLTQQELETKLNNDELAQRDLAVIASFYTEKKATAANLLQFTSVGMALTPKMILPFVNATSYPPDKNIYTLMLTTGTVLGQGTRMIQSFKLDPASTNTHVAVDSMSTHLQYSSDLSRLQPIYVKPGMAGIAVDWTNMTVNALGNPFVPTDITDIQIGKYSRTPAELQAKFLDLELIADDMWRAEVPSGTSANLSTLTNSAGSAFTGIDDSHTWVLALVCGSCANPAPWYLTLLKPCSP